MKRYDSLRIITNLTCNYRCSFCYQKEWASEYLRPEELDSILKQNNIGDLDESFNNIVLMGGEPTLSPYLEDLLKYIVENKKFHGRVSLDTNLSKPNVVAGLMYLIDKLTIDISAVYEFDEGFVLLNNFFSKYLPLLYSKELQFNYVLTSYFEYTLGVLNDTLLLIPANKEIKIYITICKDILDPSIDIMEFANYAGFDFIEHKIEIGLYLFEYEQYGKKWEIGILEPLEFDDTDLIVWKNGYTDSFQKYLHKVHLLYKQNKNKIKEKFNDNFDSYKVVLDIEKQHYDKLEQFINSLNK